MIGKATNTKKLSSGRRSHAWGSSVRDARNSDLDVVDDGELEPIDDAGKKEAATIEERSQSGLINANTGSQNYASDGG